MLSKAVPNQYQD